jgi:hypothetical protein
MPACRVYSSCWCASFRTPPPDQGDPDRAISHPITPPRYREGGQLRDPIARGDEITGQPLEGAVASKSARTTNGPEAWLSLRYTHPTPERIPCPCAYPNHPPTRLLAATPTRVENPHIRPRKPCTATETASGPRARACRTATGNHPADTPPHPTPPRLVLIGPDRRHRPRTTLPPLRRRPPEPRPNAALPRQRIPMPSPTSSSLPLLVERRLPAPGRRRTRRTDRRVSQPPAHTREAGSTKAGTSAKHHRRELDRATLSPRHRPRLGRVRRTPRRGSPRLLPRRRWWR